MKTKRGLGAVGTGVDSARSMKSGSENTRNRLKLCAVLKTTGRPDGHIHDVARMREGGEGGGGGGIARW